MELTDMKDILTEEELLGMLGIKKQALTTYRNQGLHYCRLSKTHRVYLVKDVLEFIADKRTRLNGETT